MSNHFHLLVEVPPRPAEGISDEELLARVALVQSAESVDILRKALDSLSGRNGGAVTDEGWEIHAVLREKYLGRMWDVGKFMKRLKQRFGRWFNKQHECNTIFSVILVEWMRFKLEYLSAS